MVEGEEKSGHQQTLKHHGVHHHSKQKHYMKKSPIKKIMVCQQKDSHHPNPCDPCMVYLPTFG